MATSINPYTTLGIAPTATLDEIKKAYHRIAMRLHPDKNKNAGATVQLQHINMAYELLTDSARRQQYDQMIAQRNVQTQEQPEFSMRVTPSKRYVYPFDEPQVIYLLAELYTEHSNREQAEERQRDAKINLTLVIDRSNSMSGTRMDRVKAAANQIIDQLGPADILSVVSFNDFAEVVIPAEQLDNRPMLKARVSMISAQGGTEIFKGLSLGIDQNRLHRNADFVNHVILLTDGNTFGDQERCLALAQEVAEQGIGISALGIGHEWNDEFLDTLTSITGGVAEFVANPSTVQPFLNEHVRSLANTFAERMSISIAPDADVRLEYAFRLSPRPGPITIEDPTIPLGNLQYHRLTAVLFQLELPKDLREGFRFIARISASGDIFEDRLRRHQTISDISLGVSTETQSEDPPANVRDALEKLSLYRMQERAREALERGDIQEATRRLENLATRLFEHGHEELGQQALEEARQVAYTNTLSEKGSKALKYHTRSLLLGTGSSD